ncbi:purple acid phosphatase family protein [Crenothrix polyspora]|uniref:Metallophosphoesterase/PKD domain protein n=1 Tax=Crenothrix polyspora TaxID=360316 RepID=A0A1R4H1C5_9GAMM
MKKLSLSALGLITLAVLLNNANAETLIAKGSSWRYLNDGSNQGTTWRSTKFNDNSWKVGLAKLGYGYGDEATVINSGSPQKNHITSYFRYHFTVANPADYATITLNIPRDEGSVIYINGKEVNRENMPAGDFTYSTPTTALNSKFRSYKFVTPENTLVAGDNVIAVEIHQGIADTNLSFDLELQGSNTKSQPSAKVIRGPYLQLATPQSVTIRWRTNIATSSRVLYGTTLSRPQFNKNDATLTYEHKIQLTNLQPGTRYWYSVGTNTALLAGGGIVTSFNTALRNGTQSAARIWVIGDAGTGNISQKKVYNAYRSYTGATDTDLLLMLGDNVYQSGLDLEYQDKFFAIYPDILKQFPVWPTIGNHDALSANLNDTTGPYYTVFSLPKSGEAGGVASNTESYYSFDYRNIHFVVLNSQISNAAAITAMKNWLSNDLQKNKADWLIAYWHHPPYTKGSHNSDKERELIAMRQNFLPILEDNAVDLVLTGHSHSYERSYFINGHYGLSGTFNARNIIQAGDGHEIINTNGDTTGAYRKLPGNKGTVYAVVGSSGQIGGGTLNHPAMLKSLNKLGSLVLDINGLKLNAKFLNAAGGIDDDFTISKVRPVVGKK